MTSSTIRKRLGVLTSGGDAQGMNASVRSVVRTALDKGLDVYAIYEGYQGMVDGGDRIQQLTWESVGGILHKGGTLIGTARCEAFRTHEGRVLAARNLLVHEIDNLVIIGGDGSLTCANIFRQEWRDILIELVEKGEISPEVAAHHPNLMIAGLGQEFLRKAPAVLVLTGLFQRTRWKYHERHYRYVCWEGGHVAQNVYLAAEAAGLGACMVGAFFDGTLNDLLRIDGRHEAALGLVAVGPR